MTRSKWDEKTTVAIGFMLRATHEPCETTRTQRFDLASTLLVVRNPQRLLKAELFQIMAQGGAKQLRSCHVTLARQTIRGCGKLRRQ